MRLPGGVGRLQGNSSQTAIEPLVGDPAAVAETLRAFASEGIGHVQLVLDPITIESIEALEPVLAELDSA